MREAYTQIAAGNGRTKPGARCYDAGARRLNPKVLAATAFAERWQGLPDKLHSGHVIGIAKRALPYLGLAGTARDLLDQLFAHSQPQDWAADTRPIVWPSNQDLMDATGLSRSQVKRLLRQLIEGGLIAPVDGPDGRRRGARDGQGRIAFAYGFDLAPLGVRHFELYGLVAAGEERKERRAALRRRITITRRKIFQIASTAVEYEIDGEDWEGLVMQARQLAAAAHDTEDLAGLEAAADGLESAREYAESVLRFGLESVEKNPAGSADEPPIQTTTQPPTDKSVLCIVERRHGPHGPQEPADFERANARYGRNQKEALQEKPERRSRPEQTILDQDRDGNVLDFQSFKMGPNFLIELAPIFESFVFTKHPTWPEIHDAAANVAAHLGISTHAWAEACQIMGRNRAAAAVALIVAKEGEVLNPGGYFRALTRRDAAGELFIGKSFFKLAADRRLRQ